MEISDAAPKTQVEQSSGNLRGQSFQDWVLWGGYALSLAVAVSLWFIAIGAPLWLDETVSFWQISGGFSEIWARQWNSFPAYSYILWLATRFLGQSEIALRLPSVLAMSIAAYLLYCAARELFDRDVAFMTAIIFCIHPIVIFESIDARPYAFAVLVTNAAILALTRLRRSNSNWLAAWFGFLSASILYFHYLFGVILPALAICFFVVRRGGRATLWRQTGAALAAFALGFLPVIPGLHKLFQTRATHVFAAAPTMTDLIWTLAPMFWIYILGGTALVALSIAALANRRNLQLRHFEGWRVLTCALLALVPILILYGVSVGTLLHVFVSRYCLVAIPGITLCWALIVGRFRSRIIGPMFCMVLVSTMAYHYFSSPVSRKHGYTSKYALAAVEESASVDNSPVLICSSIEESNFVAIPAHSAKKSKLFAPLSYYKLSVPVVPLPMMLNHEARVIASSFLKSATLQHQRFFAMADKPSYATLDWIVKKALGTYSVVEVGVFDGIRVLKFVPRAQIPGHP